MSVDGRADLEWALSLTKVYHPAVPFHTVLFPGYLIGSGDQWTMLDSISTTGASSSPLLSESTDFTPCRDVD